MKNVLFLVLLITLTSGKSQINSKIYDLTTALEKGLVSCTFNGNDESPHYYQPVSLEIKNLTSTQLKIQIPNGLTLNSNSPDIQDVIITKEELLVIDGSKSLNHPLFAMCIQQSNGASNGTETYQLGIIAGGNLAILTQEIEKRNAFNTLGQYAVWTITDNSDIGSISGFDQAESQHFQQFTANLLGVPVPEIDPNDYLTNYTDNIVIHRTVGGHFKYHFSKTSAVTIGMFDEQGIIVRELFNNPNTPAGKHELAYEFAADVYPNDIYYIRLIVDGQIKVNFEMKTKRS